MKLVVKDARGVEYSFDGRWSTTHDDPLSQATLKGLGQVDMLGRKAFPHITDWSEALPPQRQFENNMRVAQSMGLVVLFSSSPPQMEDGDEGY